MKKILKCIIYIAILISFVLCLTVAFRAYGGMIYHNHTFNETYIIRESSCEHGGLIKRKCSCGYTKREYTSRVSHTPGVWKIEKEATCFENGVRVLTCVQCQQVIEKQNIGMGNHTYDSWVIVEPAECGGEEKRKRVCVVCGAETETKTYYVDHVLSEWKYLKEPTYEEDGEKYRECQNCKKIVVRDIEKYASEGLLYEYISAEQAYMVSGRGICKDTTIVIPDTYYGLKVTAIKDEAFTNDQTIKSIVISCNINTIGAGAFSNCSSLEKVEFSNGNNIQIIGDYAFKNCANLSSFEFSSSLERVGDESFLYCGSLERATFYGDNTKIGKQAFYLCVSLEYVSLPENLNIIEAGTFYGCSSLQTVDMPQTTEPITISLQAFYECSALEEIIVRKVCLIEKSAFAECTSLKRIIASDLQETVTVHQNAFYRCRELNEVSINTQKLVVQENAFYSCRALQSLNKEYKYDLEVRTAAFRYCNSLETLGRVTIQASVGDSAFEACTSLTEIDMSKAIYVGNKCLYGCSSIKSVVLSDYMDSISKEMLKGCISLEEVVIGRVISEIPEEMFAGFTNLKRVVLPDLNLKTIGIRAFYGCSSLEEINIPDSVTMIKSECFKGCTSLKSIKFPSELYSIGSEAFENCTSLEKVVINDKLTSISKWCFFGCVSLSDVDLGSNCEYFVTGCFSGCVSLKSLSFSENVSVALDMSVFEGCTKLETLYAGSIQSITKYSFFGCVSLKEIYLTNDISDVKELFRSVYYKWKDLTGNYTIYYMKNGNQKSITKEEMLAQQ